VEHSLQLSLIVANCEVFVTVWSRINMLLIAPSAVVSCHLSAVLSVVSVSPVAFVTCWDRYMVWVMDVDGK